jgi:hypothetical protein
MLFNLLIGSKDLVITGLPVYLLDHPVLLIDIHIPIVDSANLQALEVSLGKKFPIIVHEPADIEGRQHDLGKYPILSQAELFQREIDA